MGGFFHMGKWFIHVPGAPNKKRKKKRKEKKYII